MINLQMMNKQLQTLHERHKPRNSDNRTHKDPKEHSKNNTSIEPRNNIDKKLSRTAQVISHISTHVVGPHFGVG
jgi:hypothetical protein